MERSRNRESVASRIHLWRQSESRSQKQETEHESHRLGNHQQMVTVTTAAPEAL